MDSQPAVRTSFLFKMVLRFVWSSYSLSLFFGGGGAACRSFTGRRGGGRSVFVCYLDMVA